jgi:hypothetical protein
LKSYFLLLLGKDGYGFPKASGSLSGHMNNILLTGSRVAIFSNFSSGGMANCEVLFEFQV